MTGVDFLAGFLGETSLETILEGFKLTLATCVHVCVCLHTHACMCMCVINVTVAFCPLHHSSPLKAGTSPAVSGNRSSWNSL